ncbi:MAG: sel1 repeat family protein [Desulfovibrio sp.]|nr:sel1 repeat family protein [Desulfovibrio sp.]
MRATIAVDPSRGPGYGIIEIEGVGAISSTSFVLQRGSDGKSLSSAGWQESETTVTPNDWAATDSGIRLNVGPEVVDELDSLDAYRISLPGSGACAMSVGKLIYSNISGGQGMGMGYRAPEAPATRPDPEPDPMPVEEPPLPEPEPEPTPEQTEPPLQMTNASETSGNGSGKLMALIAVLVLLVGGGLALWWFVLRTPETPPLPPTPGQTSPPAASATSPAQGSSAKPSEKSPLLTAREQLRGEALPDVSLAMAKPMRTAEASPEECDAAFLLLEDAAQKGNAEAMLLVGQYYDPTATLPRGSLPIDMTQAKRWYDEALQKGADKAQTQSSLDKLKDYAKAEEAKGNAEARALLQTWK